VDRPLLTEVPALKHLTNGELFAAVEKGIKLIDTRNKTDFALGFIPGSINIQGNNSFSTWAGWLLSYEEPFILIAKEDTLDDLTRKLMRIGLDNIYGFIPDISPWEKGGGTLETAEKLTAEQLNEALVNNNLQVIDLRGATEYKSGHIKGASHVFVGTITQNLDKISREKNVVVHCQGGDRAAIGYSLLRKNGFNNVRTFEGGINEWVASGKELEMN